MARYQRKTLESSAERLRLAMGRITRRLRLLSGAHELTWSQLAVMARLEALESATTATLARAEAVRPQSMGATLMALEELGLVVKAADPSDGRQLFYSLTQEGRTLRAESSSAKRVWLADRIAALDVEEQRSLIDAIAILEKMGNE